VPIAVVENAWQLADLLDTCKASKVTLWRILDCTMFEPISY